MLFSGDNYVLIFQVFTVLSTQQVLDNSGYLLLARAPKLLRTAEARDKVWNTESKAQSAEQYDEKAN